MSENKVGKENTKLTKEYVCRRASLFKALKDSIENFQTTKNQEYILSSMRVLNSFDKEISEHKLLAEEQIDQIFKIH